MFASETVFIQVRGPLLIKGRWINSHAKAAILGINPRVLPSVTSESSGFRGEGRELRARETEEKAAHVYKNE